MLQEKNKGVFQLENGCRDVWKSLDYFFHKLIFFLTYILNRPIELYFLQYVFSSIDLNILYQYIYL